MLSNKWLKFLSIILLVFPLIWLFKRFHPKGGGRWEVGGGAYPLKKVIDIPEGQETPNENGKLARNQQSQEVVDDEELPSYDNVISGPSRSIGGPSSFSASTQAPSSPNSYSKPRIIRTPTGLKKLYGVREGEWFRAWEGRILRAVVGRYRSNQPLQNDQPGWGTGLDGYHDSGWPTSPPS